MEVKLLNLFGNRFNKLNLLPNKDIIERDIQQKLVKENTNALNKNLSLETLGEILKIKKEIKVRFPENNWNNFVHWIYKRDCLTVLVLRIINHLNGSQRNTFI